MTHLSNDVEKYLQMKALITLIILMCIFGVLLFISFHFDFYPIIMTYILTGLILLDLIVLVIIRPRIYRKVTKYQVHSTRLITVEGFIFVFHKMLPLKRVQGVEVKHGIISRRYNLSKVIVHTAGTSFQMPPLKIEEAYKLQDEIIDLVKGEFLDV